MSGAVGINQPEGGLSLKALSNLTSADVLLTNLPSLYYRLLKNDSATRILANPQLRTSEGIPAQARFGERVPVPVTTFAPIAAGGVQTQPITSFNYEPIGVNIDITPRMHHDDAVYAGAEDRLEQHFRQGLRRSADVRQPPDQHRDPPEGRRDQHAGRPDSRRRADVAVAAIPGLSDIPVIGRLFAYNHKETQETDIILTLTPRIVRVLNLTRRRSPGVQGGTRRRRAADRYRAADAADSAAVAAEAARRRRRAFGRRRSSPARRGPRRRCSRRRPSSLLRRA